MSAPLVTIVGNPRADSRTHGIARTLGAELARGRAVVEVDLAVLAPRLFGDDGTAAVDDAVETVLGADLLVVASPTYKATYSGLLKAFLDRLRTGALAGAPAVPVLLGGSPHHALAVDVHLTPLLLGLGASVPVRGLFVIESGSSAFPAAAPRGPSRRLPRLGGP